MTGPLEKRRMTDPLEEENDRSPVSEQANGNDIYPMTGEPKDMFVSKKQAAVVAAIKPSAEELTALRSELRKFLSAYDEHVNDDSDNFGYDRSAHRSRLYSRPWAIAKMLGKLFQHALEFDVNSDAWDEIVESEELRRTLKTVEDVETEMRESLPLSGMSRNKLRRLLELQMHIRMAMMAQHDDFGWDMLEKAGQWSERDETTQKDRMTVDLGMLAQLALSCIIPRAEFSNWLEEVVVEGYGHPLLTRLSQHNFCDNAPTSDNDYPSESYCTPCDPTRRKRSRNVTNSNPSQKKKSRIAKNNCDVGLYVPDLTGRNDSEEKSASSPLVRGSAKQSRRDQDSQACDEGSLPARDEVGRYSSGNDEEANEMEEGSRKVLNLSSPVSVPGVNDRSCLLDALDGVLHGNTRRKVHAHMMKNMPAKGDTPIKIANGALQPHGLYLRRVYQNFINMPGGVVYNLLQLRECQIVLALDLTRADGSGVAHHAIGWDGKALLDRPHNVVIEEKDRSDKTHARRAFGELWPKETFDDWRIVQAFAIAKLRNKHKEQKKARTRKRNRRGGPGYTGGHDQREHFDVGSHVPDSTGRNYSEEKSAKSPLV